ncbi:SusC/RagA family TonB-linked outer membrane protein [Christiangramia echinicola]|uniref:TonB-linked outer membrane protein, SusC/RagA family n=1 Tax=Christiangramia echinicola TaxID=279359 RepID=A0A1H1PBC0_9FLAO|nr:SusC/RagA family TonB-linked outer membrane protein [Christiangramia echinicola]SDS08512.1 TonB-linked outer membrane protein, SusC/RagA family [Christiangramia echinicola]
MKLKTLIIAFLAVIQFATLSAQENSVSGLVTGSENGEPLVGVNVLIKGTNRGTVTDFEGTFQINVQSGETIVFSSLGFEPLEIAYSGQSTLNVTLVADLESLDEVVVTALNISRDKKSLGYATQEVGGEDINITNNQNVIGALSGRIAGVQVTGSSGASMGGTQKIKIRGVNSITGGGEPLLVIDGTPISNANFSGTAGADYGNLGQDVNPADIESVNVLKGPTASALYGIRGQYGVIMITTKKGKKGAKDIRVEINSSTTAEFAGNFIPKQNLYGAGSSLSFPTLDNGDPYVQLNYDESWGPRMDGTPVRQVFSFYPQDPTFGQLTPFVPHPDNIKDYYETGWNFNNTVSVSGGNENTTYRLSLNDTRIEGVEPNTSLNRNNLGINASLDILENLTVSTNFNYARNDAIRPQQGSEFGVAYLNQWFQRNLDMNRLRDYQYDDGTFLHWNLRTPNSETGEISNFDPLYWNNPYFDAYENYSTDNRDRFFGDVSLSYQITPEIEITGAARSDMYTQNIDNRTAFGGKDIPGYFVGKYQNREMNYELIGRYSKEFGDISFDGTVGGNIFSRKYSYLSQATVGGLSAPGFYNIAASIDRPDVTSYTLEKKIRSFFAMASLGYMDTYFLDATIRNDNSSALPEDNNSYWYPSISGSVVFSEFFDSETLSFAKFRASYAQAGSDLSPYQINPVFGVGTVYDGINTSFVPDNLNNPNIKPSFAHSYEGGVDLQFFGNRLGTSFTYYIQKNKNQIISLDVSGASGFGSSTINAGLIQNKGFELSLNGRPVYNDDFKWDVLFNIARNRSEVVELAPGIDVYTYGSTTYSSVTSYLNSYVGKPFGSLVGQAYQRDEATGEILLDDDNFPLYTDATFDFGTVLPDFTGGLQNTLNYKNFSLSALIDFQGGGQFFSRSKQLGVRTGQDPITAVTNDRGSNVRDPVEEGGGVLVSGISESTGEPVEAYVNARSYYRNVVGRRIYEEWLFDASYVKLSELRLGYTFSADVLKNLPVKSANIALIARNPAMIWQEAPDGIDPSAISTGGQDISWYESGQLATVRSFGLNLNLVF